MGLPTTIAIDGPAASGKSTLGVLLAQALGYLYFDTGVMYRALTLAALQRGLNVHDEAAIGALAETVHIDVGPPSVEDGRDCDVFLDGQDVTWEIRSDAVNSFVSDVSVYAAVRKAMTDQQRRIAYANKVVVVGRDIGSVVIPDADLKIYLDASAEVRAQRRYQEMINRGEAADYEAVLRSLKNRDQIDSTREIAPLKVVEDAVVINSDDLGIEEVLEKAKELVYRV
ncbi:MAG: (d)CMP kinase [Chloroflexi bacterium]|nr:(d)CMP kinase [Chloroflexota bacterium]